MKDTQIPTLGVPKHSEFYSYRHTVEQIETVKTISKEGDVCLKERKVERKTSLGLLFRRTVVKWGYRSESLLLSIRESLLNDSV